jgi:hypothetical protein
MCENKAIELFKKSKWLDEYDLSDTTQCYGPCQNYLTLISGEVIGWEVPPKSNLYSKPIKYKDTYICICYNCFINHYNETKKTIEECCDKK